MGVRFADARVSRAESRVLFGRLDDVTHAEYGGMTVVSWIKRVLVVLVAAFIVFYLFTRPEAAAEAVKTFFGAFEALGRFFTSLAD